MRLAIIGAGGVTASIHLPAFRLVDGVELSAICDPDPERARATGIEAVYHEDASLFRRSGADAVVIASPNYLHAAMVQAAAEAGMHVLCEKPLALNQAEARLALDAVRKAGVVHMMAFTYQFTPAIEWLRSLTAEGSLGRIRTVRAAYLMAMSHHLEGWRSLRAQAGSGVLADIGSHLIHLARYVAGDLARVTAIQRRFRTGPESDVEDWVAFLAEFASGATGTFEVSRAAPGRGAGISEEMFLEVYGSHGSAVFSLQDPWALRLQTGAEAGDPGRPLTRREIPPEFLPRHRDGHDPRWGYRFEQARQFAECVRAGRSRTPDLDDGYRCQAVLDAVLRSASSGHWEDILP